MHIFGLIFLTSTLILSACSYPYYQCNNWCYTGYSNVCCDHFGGDSGTININSQTSFCPISNCTLVQPSRTICTSDDDCLRKELCCDNPCNEGQKNCMIHIVNNPILHGCKLIKNCVDWSTNNPEKTYCRDDNDCKRSDSCCYVPCEGRNVCQKTETSTIISNVGSAQTSSRSCPIPGYCY